MTKGKIITLEGPDGAGKTSVLEQLVLKLEKDNEQSIVTTREPGGVAISESIRNIILDVNNTEMDFKTELLLYIAARRQHLVKKYFQVFRLASLFLLTVLLIVQLLIKAKEEV